MDKIREEFEKYYGKSPMKNGDFVNQYDKNMWFMWKAGYQAATKADAELVEALEAAYKYIDLSPCDPDIFPKQYEAYKKYNQLREALQNKEV